MNINPHSAANSLDAASIEVARPPAALEALAEEACRRRGRPAVRTAEMDKLIRVYGLTDSRAGLLAGASMSSVSRWKEKDAEFADYLERARAEFELYRTLKLLEATRPDGSPDWRAHAWLLKNSQREDRAAKAGRPRKEEGERGRQEVGENRSGGEQAKDSRKYSAIGEPLLGRGDERDWARLWCGSGGGGTAAKERRHSCRR